MSKHRHPTKKAKTVGTIGTIDSWFKKIGEEQSSVPLATNEQQHVNSHIQEPREFIPTDSASNVDSADHVTSAIPDVEEFVHVVDSIPADSSHSTPTGSIHTPPSFNIDSTIIKDQSHVTSPALDVTDFVVGNLERDPGKRKQIYEYPAKYST